MVNHVRTCLLNRSSQSRLPIGMLGEDYIPDNYTVKTDTAELASIRRVLFGTQPDLFTQNYRLHQYMTLLHSKPELECYVTAKDNRITYKPYSELQVITHDNAVIQLSGAATLNIYPKFKGDDNKGINYRQIRVLYSHNLNQLSVNSTYPLGTDDIAVTLNPSVGAMYETPELTLLDTGVLFKMLSITDEPDSDSEWIVNLIAVPERTLTDIFKQVPMNALHLLWERNPEFEPFKKLTTNKHNDILTKLAGVLLTVAYATDKLP